MTGSSIVSMGKPGSYEIEFDEKCEKWALYHTAESGHVYPLPMRWLHYQQAESFLARIHAILGGEPEEALVGMRLASDAMRGGQKR
jgi:hypothetical protein